MALDQSFRKMGNLKKNFFLLKMMYNKPNMVKVKKRNLLRRLRAKTLCDYFYLKEKNSQTIFLLFPRVDLNLYKISGLISLFFALSLTLFF